MRAKENGFTLMEMAISMGVMLLIVGVVFQMLEQSQQRSVSTSAVEEITTVGRDALDQMIREIRLAGYPPSGSYPAALGLNFLNSNFVAGGIVVPDPATPAITSDPYHIRFEADVDNSGTVRMIDYQIQVPPGTPGGCTAVNANLTVPTLMRSVVNKDVATAPRPPPNYEPFLDNVLNCTLNVPLFTFCAGYPAPVAGGCPALQANLASSAPPPRNTRLVMINIQVQTAVRDPQTGMFQNIELQGLAHRVNPD